MKKIFTSIFALLIALCATAQLSYNVELTQADFNNPSTIIKKEGKIEWDGGIRCGGTNSGAFSDDAWNWDDKAVVIALAAGVPNKLMFKHATNNSTSTKGSADWSAPDWYVHESADGNTWKQVWTVNYNSKDLSNEQTVSLSPTTRYIRLCFSGNFAGYFKNIKVTEIIEMSAATPATLDFGTLKVDEVVAPQDFVVNYTGLTATATSADAHFTVTPASFGDLYAYQAAQTLSVVMATNEAGTYNSTITVAGRGKQAEVTVTGKVEKHDQTINWNPAQSVNHGQTIPLATATSGLPVSYEISDPKVLVFEKGAFRTLRGGKVTVTAKQEGNYKYNPATPVQRTITIVPPVTYGKFEAAACQGETITFNGVDYTKSTTTEVRVAENYLGGDSIVRVNITINQPTASQHNKTIVFGTKETWNGNDLSVLAVGNHELKYTTTNAAGCDSIVTLNLTVSKQAVVEMPVSLRFCEGDSVAYRGKWYKEAGKDEITATGAVADTIYKVTIVVNKPTYTEDKQTVIVGNTITFAEEGWLLRDTMPVKEYTTTKADTADLWFIRYDQTAEGCEAITKRSVTIELMDPYENERELEFCKGDSVEYRGKWYKEQGIDSIWVEGNIQDTLIIVLSVVYMPEAIDLYDTITVGDVVELGAGEWTLGEQTLTGSYEAQEADTVGLVFIQYGQTEDGCESRTTLYVTVEPRSTEGFESVGQNPTALKVLRDGVVYIRRGENEYTLYGERVQ